MKNNLSKSDIIVNRIFYSIGLLIAFAGFIAVLFVGVFMAAASVYTMYRSCLLDGAGKIACGWLFSLFMLAMCALLAYLDIFIVKTVAIRIGSFTEPEKPDTDRDGKNSPESDNR